MKQTRQHHLFLVQMLEIRDEKRHKLSGEEKTTCLNDFHIAHGARMAPFAGYMMPLNYTDGPLKEHMACRAGAAVFDVSHMAQLDITHPSGQAAPILAALEGVIPANLIDLPEFHQRYGLLLNPQGGILDDVMVIHAGSYVRMVVNAACADKDISWLAAHLTGFKISRLQRALVAVQGPAAAKAVEQAWYPCQKRYAFFRWRLANLMANK